MATRPEPEADALITGKRAVVAEGGMVRSSFTSTGTAGHQDHGSSGPGVKDPVPGLRLPGEMTQSQLLQEAWIELLEPFGFQWFCTLTFELNLHPEAGFKKFRRFTNEINRALYGRRWMKSAQGGIHWVVALERQKRGVIHFHALMGSPEDLNQVARRLSWMDRWEQLAGFARIEPIRDNTAVRRYVTKNVIKGGDIEFSTNLGQSQQAHLFD